jgi:hypothetical protein
MFPISVWRLLVEVIYHLLYINIYVAKNILMDLAQASFRFVRKGKELFGDM